MRIYYDGIIYGAYRHRPGGISNFFDHLISRVAQHHECLLTSSRPKHLPHPHGPHLQIARHNLQIRPDRLNQKLQKHNFSIRASLFRPNIIHATYYDKPAIYQAQAPIVYTAHDMIHEKWSHQLDPFDQVKAKKLWCFERAAAIPCVSEATREDLLKLYPHLEAKTSIIHLAGGLKADASRNYSLGSNDKLIPYILYVGARSSYKNFARLALAYARISSQYKWLKFKVVGAPFASHEVDLLDALDIKCKVEIYPDLADEDLYDLYRSALAFVYPSLYEGFGIPLLEAMALNAPVLAANTSSIPEVAGEAALLFNPWSVDDIYDAILQIIRRPSLRDDLIRKGQRRIQDFSWEKTATAYLDLYERLVFNRPEHSMSCRRG